MSGSWSVGSVRAYVVTRCPLDAKRYQDGTVAPRRIDTPVYRYVRVSVHARIGTLAYREPRRTAAGGTPHAVARFRTFRTGAAPASRRSKITPERAQELYAAVLDLLRRAATSR